MANNMEKPILDSLEVFLESEAQYKPAMLSDFPHLDKRFYEAGKQFFLEKGFTLLGDYQNLIVLDSPSRTQTFTRCLVGKDKTVTARFYDVNFGFFGNLRKRLQGIQFGPVVELETEFNDGIFILTSSAGSEATDQLPPQIGAQFFPFKTRPADLLKVHLERIAQHQLTNVGSRPVKIGSLREVYKSQHRKQIANSAFRNGIDSVNQKDLRGLPKVKAEVSGPASIEVAQLFSPPAEQLYAREPSTSNLTIETVLNATTADIAGLWSRLESWAEKNAPAMLAKPAPGATAEEIASLEQSMGLRLPADLRESLLIHNGESEGWPNLTFADRGIYFPVQAILENWNQRRSIASSKPDIYGERTIEEMIQDGDLDVEGPVQAKHFLDAWIPIMDLNRDVFWALDLAPLEGGQIGQMIEVDWEGASWRVIANSFGQFFEHYVDELESGVYKLVDGLPTKVAYN